MRVQSRHSIAVACLGLMMLPAASGADEVSSVPSNAQMWEMLQEQQKLIQQQQAEIRSLHEKLEAAGDAIEEVQGVRMADEGPGDAADSADSEYAVGRDRPRSSAASTGRRWWERTTIGSYGEMHYNNLQDRNANDERKQQLDFHRFVLFIGHEFTDRIRLFSELEIEHALVFGDSEKDSPGEVEIEQAFIEMDLFQDYTARGGLFLIPVGILNETHEPNTFYGVERNPVEKNVIPTTWWEGGIGGQARWGHGISADLTLTTGLKPTDFNVRSGRQKVAKADADHGAVTGRLAWRGLPGLELAGTIQYQTNMDGSDVDKTGATLFETHLIYNRGPIGLRALYARWDMFSALSDVNGTNQQYGFYVEPSIKPHEMVGIFGRFSQWDNAAGDARLQSNQYRQYDLGLNFWPIPNVVLKFDYQWQDAPDTGISGSGTPKEEEGFNLGIGYSF